MKIPTSILVKFHFLWGIYVYNVAQRLEQSACNREVMGSSSTGGELFFISENFECFKKNF